MNNYEIRANEQYQSNEIYFNGKPDEDTRNALKGLGMRWNHKKLCWYGFKSADEINAALGGTVEVVATTNTKQEHIKIYWNGIQIDGGELVKTYISKNSDGVIRLYVRDDCSGRLPFDLVDVENETDWYTDYFDTDHTTITPEHALYKYFEYAQKKYEIHDLKRCVSWRKQRIAKGKDRTGIYEKELAEYEQRLAEAEKNLGADPGQPTAEDLAKIESERLARENEIKEKEQAEEQRREENYRCKRGNGKRTLDKFMELFPLKEGDTKVIIEWSEHPAISGFWNDNELEMSLTAADLALGVLDDTQNRERETAIGSGWYDKTSFKIVWTDENGEESSYTGRYDLGDGEHGLINHIANFGEWERTHDTFGKVKENPEEATEILELVKRFRKEVEGCQQQKE